MSREPIRSIAALADLDGAEILQGYHDGLAGDGEPGDNHSLAYWHGWRNGRADRTCAPDENQRALAADYLAEQDRRKQT